LNYPTLMHAIRSAIIRLPLHSIESRSVPYRLIALATILSIVFGGLATLPAEADAAGATTTSALNLRSGPGTTFSVIRVIPDGAAVEVTGDPQAGFYPVTYNGSSGFVSGDYLSMGGGGGGGGVTTGGPTGTRYVMDGSLNLRSGPSTSDSVITVLRDGAAVELSGEGSNGFARVTYNGTAGWAFAQYLSTNGGGTPGSNNGGTSGGGGSVAVGDSVTGSATVVDGRLNLRRGPGTNYAVISVMPNGAAVELMGSAQSGFYPIRYSGAKGWASADYLSVGGGSTPTPPAAPPANNGSVPVGNQVTDNQITTSALNLRSGPATSYGVVKVLPPGSKVDIMGSASGSYLPVRWAGYKGWAHGDWLVDVGSAPAPTPAPGAGQGGDMVQIIYAAADKWGQPRADMLRVARCESNLDPRAVNTSSGASGLFQFMPSTFAFTPNGKAGQNIFDPYASADATGWMWANGMRNHWACQ